MILLPRQQLVQPRHIARIDSQHPWSRDITVFIDPMSMRNLVTGRPLETTGTIDRLNIYAPGIASSCPFNSENHSLSAGGHGISTGPMTEVVFVSEVLPYFGGLFTYVSGSHNGTTGGGISLNHGSSQGAWRLFTGAAGVDSGDAIANGERVSMFAYTRDGIDTYRIYRDGRLVKTESGLGSPDQGVATGFAVNNLGPGLAGLSTRTPVLYGFRAKREFSTAEMRGLWDRPWQMVASPRGRSFVPVAFDAGAGAITGTSSVTLGDVTSTGTGTVRVSGSQAVALGAVTSTGAGSVRVTGQSSVTLGAVTSTGSGVVGAAPILGQSNVTLGAVTSAGAGSVRVAGSQSSTLDAVTSSGAGAVRVTGQSSVTLGAVTSTGSGVVGAAPVIGQSNVTLGAVTSSGAGTVRIAGTSAVTLAGITSTGAGSVRVTGSSNVTLGAMVSSSPNNALRRRPVVFSIGV